MAEVERRAAAYGLPPVRWPEPWPGNMLLAMRAATAAAQISPDAGRAFLLSAVRLGFRDGRDLSDPAAVTDAAAAAGLDGDALLAAAVTPVVKAALRERTDEAIALGVRGVPSVVVDGEAFWGDDRLEEAAAAAATGYRVLPAADAYWRRSNMMGILNTDLGAQLRADALGARLWRLEPGQASTRHRHVEQSELYLLLEGTGRIRVGEDLLTLEPLSSLLVEPRTTRQVFNDTDRDALWLVVGAPPELANTREMTAEQLADLYPDGPRALPPELGTGH